MRVICIIHILSLIITSAKKHKRSAESTKRFMLQEQKSFLSIFIFKESRQRIFFVNFLWENDNEEPNNVELYMILWPYFRDTFLPSEKNALHFLSRSLGTRENGGYK